MLASRSPLKVRLRVVRGQHAGEKIRVRGPAFIIGRDPECQLRPNSPLVSRRHAMIDIEDQRVVLCDLGSRNGTLRNGEPLAGPTSLQDGDRVEVGPLLFAVSIRSRRPAASIAAAETEAPAEAEMDADSDPGTDSWNVIDEPIPDPDAPMEDVEDLLRTMRLS